MTSERFQNGKFLNVNHVDPNLKEVELSVNALTNVYLGRCEYNRDNTCTAPKGEFSDLNMWLEDLPSSELIEWTSCL